MPAEVTDPSWRSWLIGMPEVPAKGFGAAMVFSRRLERHLAVTPDVQLLSKPEARDVALDLLIFADDLQARVQVKASLGLGNFASAGASAVGAALIPGAAIPLIFLSTGFFGLGCVKKYNVHREQDLIERLKVRLKVLIRRLRR